MPAPKLAVSREEAADAISVDIQTIDRTIAKKELRWSALFRQLFESRDAAR